MSWSFIVQQNTNAQSVLQADSVSIALEGPHRDHRIQCSYEEEGASSEHEKL